MLLLNRLKSKKSKPRPPPSAQPERVASPPVQQQQQPPPQTRWNIPTLQYTSDNSKVCKKILKLAKKYQSGCF